MMGNAIREEWKFWSQLLGLGTVLTVDTTWMFSFAFL